MNIAKEYGGRVLFSGVCLTIASSERIGLVGPNGSGKTTLLEILAGRIEPSEGDVSVNRRASVGYLTQEVPATGERTLLQEMLAGHEHLDRLSHRLALIEEEMRGTEDRIDLERLAAEQGELERRFDLGGGYDLPSEAKRILGGLAFQEEDFHRPLSHFSGGWLMRLSLGRLLLLEPDLLLLDEPTNYLDLDSVIWLEGYLREYAGSMVVVSHDRVLLNTLSERILEIDGEKIVAYQGNYDAYLKARALREEGLQAARKEQERKIAKTQAFIDRFRAKNTLARRVQSRIKQLEKMEEVRLSQDRKRMHLAFPDPPRAGRVPIELRGAKKSYGENRVYTGIDLRVERGERIVLVGPNGAGKSTLLKILGGVLDVDAGERRLGHNVRTAYYAQHQVEALDYGKSVIDEVREAAPGLIDQEIRSLLGRFLFTGDDVFKRIAVLSGGEKARVALAKLLLHPPNLLLLDEPTSHLDISARDVLAEALMEYKGSLVMISHDRHFIDRLSNRVLEIGGGGIRSYLGPYSEYLERKRAEREEEASPAAFLSEGDDRPARKESARKGKEERRREAEARNRRYRTLHPVKEEIRTLEKEIMALEKMVADLEGRMASTEFYEERSGFEETFREYQRLQAEIGAKTERWEELTERLEALERGLAAELPDRERA